MGAYPERLHDTHLWSQPPYAGMPYVDNLIIDATARGWFLAHAQGLTNGEKDECGKKQVIGMHLPVRRHRRAGGNATR